MRIQSVSASSFMYNSQSSSNSSSADGNISAASGNRSVSTSYRHYDILDLSDIDLGDNNTLDVEDIEKALQSDRVSGKRNIHATMNIDSAHQPKITNKGFDSPFLKNSPNEFILEAARIFSAYLNPEMSGGDDKVFAYAGDDFETAFNEFVKNQSTQYANQLTCFFAENDLPSSEQVNKFVGEITEVIKEYGTQLAAGKDIDIEDLTSKLHINGVGITVGELNKMVATINDINPSKMMLDAHADFAVTGLGVAKMKAFAINSFSKPVAEMVMKTYDQKVAEEIGKNDDKIELSKKSKKKNNFIERYLRGDSPEIKSKKDNNQSVDPYFKLDSKFKGSAKEDIFNLFSKIDISSNEKSKEDYDLAVSEFEKIMKKWEQKRGYALSSRDVLSNSLKISAAFEELDGYIGLALENKTEITLRN